MNRKRILAGLWVAMLLLALAACSGRDGGDENSPDGGTVQPDNESHQGEDPTQGEADKGEAVGSQDESLEGLGGGYVWRREGGIAGFCDVVTVLAGTATVASCATDPPEIVGEVTLTAAQARLMTTWLEELKTFDHTRRDPATADAMTITIIFAGEGDNEPTDDIIAELDALAAEVLQANRNPTQ